MYGTEQLSPLSQIKKHGLAHYHDKKEKKKSELQNVKQKVINSMRLEQIATLDERNKQALNGIRTNKYFSNEMKKNSSQLQEQDYLRSKKHILSNDWINDNKDMIARRIASETDQIHRDIEGINRSIGEVNNLRGEGLFQLSNSPISNRSRPLQNQLYAQDTTQSQNKTSQNKTPARRASTCPVNLQHRYHNTPIPTPAGAAVAKASADTRYSDSRQPSPTVDEMRKSLVDDQSLSQVNLSALRSTIDTDDSCRFDKQLSMDMNDMPKGDNGDDDFNMMDNESGGFTNPNVAEGAAMEFINSLPDANDDSTTNSTPTATFSKDNANDPYPYLPANRQHCHSHGTWQRQMQDAVLTYVHGVDTDDNMDEEEEDDDDLFILTQCKNTIDQGILSDDASSLPLTQIDIEGDLLQYGQGYIPKSQLTLSQFDEDVTKTWEEWLSPTEIVEKICVMLEALRNELSGSEQSHLPKQMHRLRRTISLLLSFHDNVKGGIFMSYRALYYVEGGMLCCSYNTSRQLVNKISEMLRVPVYGLGITPHSRGMFILYTVSIYDNHSIPFCELKCTILF